MSAAVAEVGHAEPGALRAAYDAVLPRVYGYLVARCGDATLAEDLCQEVFLAAARAMRDGQLHSLDGPWLVAVARNKLVDHFRRSERERRALSLVWDAEQRDAEQLVWDPPTSRDRALRALASLPETQRVAVTLRYVDGLSVPDVAAALQRSVHATESLLARGRDTFRRRFQEDDDG